MAKIHVRYMVGGPPGVASTTRCSIGSTSRSAPARCCVFSSHMGEHWNISLFHYRNHGSDYGRVLIGMQVPADELDTIEPFLDELGYAWKEETKNPAYEVFLR